MGGCEPASGLTRFGAEGCPPENTNDPADKYFVGGSIEAVAESGRQQHDPPTNEE